MTRQFLEFQSPGRVAVADEPLRAPGAGEVRVRALVSAISAGTERLALRGDLPADLPRDEILPGLAGGGGFTFPFRYGYATVGRVDALGADVDPAWRERRVFGFEPHASAFVARPDALVPVPDDVPDDAAALFANAETAVNLLLDAIPVLGERVLIIGQGVVGLLATALLARFPLAALAAIDPVPVRRDLALRFGATAALAPGGDVRAALGGPADLVLELSGASGALDVAISSVGSEGRVVVGAWYGGRSTSLHLGGNFHRGRVRIISSQVSRIGGAHTPRWDRARRAAEAWRVLATIDAAALITQRASLRAAPALYTQLLERPAEVLQALFVHS